LQSQEPEVPTPAPATTSCTAAAATITGDDEILGADGSDVIDPGPGNNDVKYGSQ
jgi:hypothetical protein